jgi:hypothetical protein
VSRYCCPATSGGEREWPKRKNREGLSTVADWRAGGPARSSGEPFVMKGELVNMNVEGGSWLRWRTLLEAVLYE